MGGGQRCDASDARSRHGLARGERGTADAGLAGDAHLGQRTGTRLPANHRRRCRLSFHRDRAGREQDRRRDHLASLLTDLPPRHAEDRRLLHPARRPHRGYGRRRPAGAELCGPAQGWWNQDLYKEDRRLARHDRQVLGGRPDPRPEVALRCQGLRGQRRQGVFPDRLLDGRGLSAAGRPRLEHQQSFRGRKAGHPHRGLPREAQRQELRSDDRLGLVLFHHQAAVQAAALALPGARQLRPRRPRHHRAREGRILSARQQELRVRWRR